MARLVLIGIFLFSFTQQALASNDPDVLLERARLQYHAGQWGEAASTYEKALSVAPPNSQHYIASLLERTSLFWERGNYRQARQGLEQARQWIESNEAQAYESAALLSIGQLEVAHGNLSAASDAFTACLATAQRYQDVLYTALCRTSLRSVRTIRGQNPGSDAEYRRDLEALRRTEVPLMVASSMARSAELHARAGDPNASLELLYLAQEMMEDAGSVPAAARNRLRIAQTLQDLGRFEDATAQLTGLQKDFESMGNRPALATLHGLLARQADRTGDGQQAQRHANRSLQLAHSTGHVQLIGSAHLNLCEIHARRRSASTPEHCQAARDTFARHGAGELATRAHILEARYYQAVENWSASRQAYHEVLRDLAKIDPASAQVKTTQAIQIANLCQVEMQLDSAGTFEVCRDALEAIRSHATSDPTYAVMEAGTLFASGISAPRPQAAGFLREALDRYKRLGAYERAAESSLRLAVARPDQADAHFEEAIVLLEQTDPFNHRLAVEIRTRAVEHHMDRDESQKAKLHLEKLILSARERQDHLTWAWALTVKAQILVRSGDRSAARQVLENALVIAQRSDDASMVDNIERNLQRLK